VRTEPTIDGMAALDADTLRVLMWNYHDDLVAVAPTPVQLAVKVPVSFGAKVRVSHTRVDETHGDAYTAWVAQGSPANPSPTQIAALEQAMIPRRSFPTKSFRWPWIARCAWTSSCPASVCRSSRSRRPLAAAREARHRPGRAKVVVRVASGRAVTARHGCSRWAFWRSSRSHAIAMPPHAAVRGRTPTEAR
jgi:hypothetical protein